MATPLPKEFVPHVEATRRSTVTHAETQFGVGVIQQKRDRVNAIAAIWELKFPTLSLAAANRLADFLEARRGTEAILWQPPGETEALQFTVEAIDRAFTRSLHSTITATFEQVF